MIKYIDAICPCCSAQREILKVCYKKLEGKYDLMECLNCGYGFIKPTPTESELNDYYLHYEGGLCKSNINTNLDINNFIKLNTANIHDCKRRIIFALNKAKINHKKLNSGLDLGCSFGTGVVALESFTKKARGIDIDMDAISIAKQYLGDKVKIQKIDSIESGSQDVITHFNVLEHVRDPLHELNEISRCLTKNSGIYILKVPNFGSIWAKMLKENWYLMCPPEHLNFFTHQSLKIALNKAGLKQIFIGTTWGEATPSVLNFGIRSKISAMIVSIDKKNIGNKYPKSSIFLIGLLRTLFKFLTLTKRLLYRFSDLIILSFRMQGNTITAIAIQDGSS